MCLCAGGMQGVKSLPSHPLTAKAKILNSVSVCGPWRSGVSAVSMTRLTHTNECSIQISIDKKKKKKKKTPLWLHILSFTPFINIHRIRQIYVSACVSALMYVCVRTLARGRTLPPSRSVTNYLIKFHCIKATFYEFSAVPGPLFARKWD